MSIAMPFFTNYKDASNINVLATLYKKLIGYANTNSDTVIANEVPLSASPFVLASNVATQEVPTTGVPNTDNINKRTGFSVPDATSSVTYGGFNITTFDTSGGLKCTWISNNHIIYYSNLVLTSIGTNPNNSFLYKSINENILNRAIDENQSTGVNKYHILVEKQISINNWQTVAKSDYIFDRDAGILTVYEADSVISSTNPPRISFWRYEGTLLSQTNVNNPGSGSGVSLPKGMSNGDILYSDGNGGIGFESQLKYDSSNNVLTISGERVLTQYDVDYETTKWVYKNLIDAPPAVSSTTLIDPTSNSITCKWVNFERKKVGFSTSALPNVTALNIDIFNASGTRLATYPKQITSGIEDSSGTLLIDTLRIIKGLGSEGPSENIYTVYIPLGTTTPLKVDIWYSNNIDKIYKLNFTGLSFAAAGSVSVPTSITLSASGKTTGTYSISLSGLSADTADPTIKYTQSSVTIKPVSSFKYGYDTTGVTITATDSISLTDTDTSGTFTGLIPGTTYNFDSAKMTNQLDNIGTTTGLSGSFTTSDPLIPTSNYIKSKTIVNTTMFNTYQNSVIYSGITQISGTAYIMNKDISSNYMDIQNIYLHTISNYGNKINGDVSKFVIGVSGNNITSNQANITYKSFPAGQVPVLTNSGIIDISGYKNTSDTNISDGSGYVLESSFKYKILNGLTPSSFPYTLKITQQIMGDGYSFSDLSSNTYNFYVDDLPPDTAPSFKSDIGYNTISDISNNLLVCGVPLNNGNWFFKLANVTTTNHIRYFNKGSILQYTFANTSQSTTLVDKYSGTIPGDINGTTLIDNSGTIISSTSQDAQLRYIGYINEPRLILYANSINIVTSNNQGSIIKNVPVIITKNTADKFASIHPSSTPITTSSGVTGERMMTITVNSVDMRDTTNLDTSGTYQDYSGCRLKYDNTKLLTKLLTSDVVPQSGYCELQMIEGKFLTRAYTGTGSGIAYKDYSTLTTSLVNYSSIASENGYRWATFRWQANGSATTVLNGCKFVMSGITSGSSNATYTLHNDANNDGLYFDSDKSARIRVLYRVEDMSVNNGTPSGVLNQASLPAGNLSTVWIDATRQNTDNTFGRDMGIYAQSGLLSGGTFKPTVAEGSTTFITNIPALSKPVNIYAMVGLPMHTDIAFEDIKCYTQASGF